MRKSESQLHIEGMNALLDKLRVIDTEQFISLMIREPFDDTQWQEQNLNFEGASVRDLSKQAMEQYQGE